jgi:ATP-dependent Clp protease ATP-binding subunit ClpC
MATTMCDVCGVRPAVVTVRRMVPGQGPRIENLCEVHAAEARGGRSSFGRSPLGGGSLFDEFFGGFFDEEPSGLRGRVPSPARQAEQIDITRFFSDSMQELVQRAARKAVEWGSLDLTGEHLLWAALQDGVVRRVLEGTGADADEIGAQLEDEAEKGGRTEVSPSLAPDAKRALLAAYEESRALGASYIGPEHVLLALASDEESDAGRLLERFGVSHTGLRGAVVRGVDTASGETREPPSPTPTLDEYSRDLTRMAKEGKLDPVIGRAGEVETTIEILSRRTKNNPVLIRDPGVGKTAIVES